MAEVPKEAWQMVEHGIVDGDDDALLDLLAERQIVRVINRYARAVDTIDLDAVGTCYWEDGHDTHAGVSRSATEYLDWLAQVLPPLGPLTHQFTNVTVDIGPGRSEATSEAYCFNVLTLPPADGQVHITTSCLLYEDRWEQRHGEWRILDRHCSRLWTQAGAIPRDAFQPPPATPSRT